MCIQGRRSSIRVPNLKLAGSVVIDVALRIPFRAFSIKTRSSQVLEESTTISHEHFAVTISMRSVSSRDERFANVSRQRLFHIADALVIYIQSRDRRKIKEF